MSDKVTLAELALVQEYAAQPHQEPPSVILSLGHLSHADAAAGRPPRRMTFLLTPALAEQLAASLQQAARQVTRGRPN